MTRRPILFFNRHTGQVEEESVYGERWLRWIYGSWTGALTGRLVARRIWFSRWYGWRMDRPASRSKISPFIDSFNIDVSEFADAPGAFRSFNEFFYRRLRDGARPVDPRAGVAVFPADGRHLGFANLGASDHFFVKGQAFDLNSFLGDPELTRRYSGGPAVFSRLCPVDYHRFHFPVPGTPGPARRINGCLASVSPIALVRNLAWLWENRRWLTEIESPGFGHVLMAEIGATNVGSAVHTFEPGQSVPKGQEKGYFRFGGSAVLTLFEPGRVRLADDLLACSRLPQEMYSRMGTPMAFAVSER
ncbi:MAG: phosphatidylserine decarboxylase [Limisphaerales bacterium]